MPARPRTPARPTHGRPTRARRTQAERREATQTRLLDATIACLAKRGYAGMSTNEVVRRAGVSRGALVHHYPTKARLAVAALERWLDERIVQFEADFTALPEAERRADRAIDVLWAIFSEPTFSAVLELFVAARSDHELRARLLTMNQKFNEGVAATFARVFPAADAEPPFDPQIAIHFAFTVLSGAALNLVLDEPDAPTPTPVTSLKLLAGLLVNEPWRPNA